MIVAKRISFTFFAQILLFLTIITFSICNFSKVSAAAPTFTVDFGTVETVYNWSTQKCAEDDITDFPARALVDSDGNVQLYTTEVHNRKFIGSNLTDIHHDCHIIMESHFNAIPRAYDDFEWLISPYTLSGTTIYGLVHTEYHGYAHSNCNDTTLPVLNCWWNSINLAKSTDKGYNFTHELPTAHNIANISIDYNPNNTTRHLGILQPSNIIYENGYYYATVDSRMGNDNYRVCLMRTNNLEDPNSWKFWDGTGFNLNTKNLSPNANCAKTADIDFNLQRNTYLGGYTIVGSGTNTIRVQTGSSLTSWNPITDLPAAWNNPAFYATILQPGAETRNFEDVGRSPWLYYVTCGGDGITPCNKFIDNNRNLKRVRIRFNKPEDVGKYDVLDLHFNEYTGNKTLDSSFYGNDGYLQGLPNFIQGTDKRFLRFTPQTAGEFTHNVGVPYSPSLNVTGNLSIRVQIRTEQKPGKDEYVPIIAKQDQAKRHFALYLIEGGKLHFSMSTPTGYAGSTSIRSINDGLWHDVVVTFSDSTGIATYWIDDTLDRNIKQGGKLIDSVSNSAINIGGNLFSGDLNSLTVYNYLVKTPPALVPGDFDGDNHVTIFDYNKVVSKFGNPYNLFDFNAVIENFGK